MSIAEPDVGDPAVEPQQCGRCRKFFAGDPTLTPATIADWWLCTVCRQRLLGLPC
jgi:hypothetical protein